MSGDEKRPHEMLRRMMRGGELEKIIEDKTKMMKHCSFCGEITYRKKPMKTIGKKWICIDCLRQLKEMLDELDSWEREVHIKEKIEQQLQDELATRSNETQR